MNVLDRVVDFFSPRPARMVKSLMKNPQLALAQRMAADSEFLGLSPGRLLARDTTIEVTGKEPGPEVWGSPLAATDAYGLIESIFVTGQLPKKGTRELYAMYSTSARLRSAVQRLARDVSSVPIEFLAAATPTGQREIAEYKSLTGVHSKELRRKRHKMRKDLLSSGDFKPVPETHPAYQFIKAGNPKLNGRQSRFIQQVMKILKGDTYAIKVRGGPGGKVPIRWYPIPGYWVIMSPTSARPFHRCQWGTWYCDVPEEDMMWWTDPDPLNPYGRGTGVGESLAVNLETEHAAAVHMNRTLRNGANPSQMITVKGANRIQLREMEQRWMERHLGLDRAGRPHFTGAEVDVKSLESTFRDLELIKLREFEKDTIAEVIHIPKELDGNLSAANRAAAGAVRWFYLEFTVTPNVEDELVDWNQTIEVEFNGEVVADYEPFVPADDDRIQSVMTAFPQAFRVNEARELAGFDEDPDRGEQYLSPMPVAAPPGGLAAAKPAAKPPGAVTNPKPKPPSSAESGADN